MSDQKYPRHTSDLVNLRDAVKTFLISQGPAPEPLIRPGIRVRTQGSCFAENIARGLIAAGVAASYLPFQEPINSPLANRAFFEYLLDPALPYARPEHAEVFNAKTLLKMREKLPNEDVFIFTLGLAPCMFRKGDDIPSFTIDPRRVDAYEMRHTSVAENEAALRYVIDAVRKFNPAVKVVLTLSPVPLNRTFDLGPAIEIDCISKSTLRVAVANVMRDRRDDVYYWPSFEIVRWLAPHISPAYGADDGFVRHVNNDLVALIVELFIERYGTGFTKAMIEETRQP